MKDWKTTLAGVLTIVGAITSAGLAYLNKQPINTTATFTALTVGVGLIKAADSK